MKILTTLIMLNISFAYAQENTLTNNLQINTLQLEANSKLPLKTVHFDFKNNKKLITKKKSYKNIIENKLSGRKNLLFKPEQNIKVC